MYQAQYAGYGYGYGYAYDEGDIYSYTTPDYTTSSVDCTLSLATPSPRLTNHEKKRRSGFGWTDPPPSPSAVKGHRGSSASGGGDPLLACRCANCDTTSTPLWRNGPKGPKSLCNACGIRFKKEEKRAAAAAGGGSSGEASQCIMNNNSWVQQQQYDTTSCYYPCPYGSDFRRVVENDVIMDYDTDATAASSWRFNVTDHPGNDDWTR